MTSRIVSLFLFPLVVAFAVFSNIKFTDKIIYIYLYEKLYILKQHVTSLRMPIFSKKKEILSNIFFGLLEEI